MRGKFKFRFSKWKLPFYPCYHAFLWCLIVKDYYVTCFGCSPRVSHKPKFLALSWWTMIGKGKWDFCYSVFALNEVRGTRTQPLISVGCSVQLIREFFLRLHLCRHTFASLWSACYVLAHFDALPHVVIHVSSAFIFQTFAEVSYSVFVK